VTFVEEQLLDNFGTYDRSADIVSAFEYLFTQVVGLSETVLHFERFPNVPHGDGNPATPDFTVVFNDQSGLAGEVARFALADESVDGLCQQIGRYDSLETLPGQGTVESVRYVDVLLIVPLRLGTTTVQRVVRDRQMVNDHPYAPSASPCVVQWGEDGGLYSFSRLGEQENGRLREGMRNPAIGRWLDTNPINVHVDRFREIKSSWVFVNDPIDPLYLATHPWAKTFPTIAGDAGIQSPAVLTLNAQQLAQVLRDQFGIGRATDVRKAMELLVRANLAEPSGADEWNVAWSQLVLRRGETDLHQALASRAENPPKTSTVTRVRRAQALRPPAEPPPTLFDQH
jgi:hypothetical protein